MARGALWMVLFKLLERSLGLISTLILVRLLSPADFGIVAMATSFIFMAELLAAFGFDLRLEVRLNGTLVAQPPYTGMYWSPAQMLAHLTVNGASVRPGDLFASGTISGPGPGERGSLLELSWGGAEPLTLDDGAVRTFLQDGDEVVLRATAPGVGGGRIGLGDVSGHILPS